MLRLAGRGGDEPVAVRLNACQQVIVADGKAGRAVQRKVIRSDGLDAELAAGGRVIDADLMLMVR